MQNYHPTEDEMICQWIGVLSKLTYSCRFCVYSTGSCTSLVFQESWGEVVWFSHNFNQSLWYMNELSLYQVIRSWSAECRGHVSIHFIVILWSKTMILYFLVSEHRFFLKTGMPMHVSLGILGSATVVVNSSTNSFCTYSKWRAYIYACQELVATHKGMY